MPGGTMASRFTEHFADGRSARQVERPLAGEVPVALEFNGVTWAVMMATPEDLADYARGFAIGEGLISPDAPPLSVDVARIDDGWIVRTRLPGSNAGTMAERVRRRIGDSSCGLCGMDTLAEVARPLPPVAVPMQPEPAAIFRAGSMLRDHQPIGRATGAAHAAAICTMDGAIACVREDVGRHNAFDKAIGAWTAAGAGPGGAAPHFAMLSARCSFELVEKAVRSGLSALVTISAPTSMAVERARDAGLPLFVLARGDSVLELT